MTEEELMDTAEKAAVKLARKSPPGYEIYVKESSSTSVEVKEQKLDAFERSSTWGVGVRVLGEGGRMGFAFSTGSDTAVEDAVARALENARNAEPDEHNILALPPGSPYPDASIFDERVGGISEQQKIDEAMALESAALGFDPRVKRVRNVSTGYTESRWAILSSTGVRASSGGTYLSCGVMVAAEEAGDSQMGYDFDYRRRAGEIDFGAVGRSAAARAVGLLGAKKTPSGMMPVLLDNIVATQFLGVLASSLSGESLIKGKSMLAERLGKAVCSGMISIVDDGLMKDGNGTRPFDDEGVPSRRTPLIEHGELVAFLHNTYSAGRLKKKSTGNASRGGFRTQPGVGSTNLYIEKGDVAREKLISGITRGVLVSEVLGMHTANPISGDFSVGIAGHMIENGEVSHPVREGAISGNILEIFSSVDALGSDMRFTGRIGAPSILLRPISVSGS